MGSVPPVCLTHKPVLWESRCFVRYSQDSRNCTQYSPCLIYIYIAQIIWRARSVFALCSRNCRDRMVYKRALLQKTYEAYCLHFNYVSEDIDRSVQILGDVFQK